MPEAASQSPAIVIVSYRRADLLRQCLESAAATLPASAVHVWDNRSDGTDEIRALAEQFVDVDWHFCDENLGFAAAVNRLAERSSGSTFLLLNPDAQLIGDLSGCRTLLATDTAVAAAAPLIAEAGDDQGWSNAHREPSLLRQITSYAGVDARVGHHPRLSLTYGERPSAVDGYLTGACLLISRAAWERVGPFDERYFLYGEEADWQRRARNRGYRIELVDEPGVVHSAGGTVSDDPAAARMSLDRLNAARRRYLADHHGRAAAVAFDAATRVLDRVQRSKRALRAPAPGAKPRFIITTPTLEFGGAERQRVTLANALVARGCDVELRILQRTGPLGQQVDPRVHVTVAPYRVVRAAPPGQTLLVTGTTLIEVAHGMAWRRRNGDRGRWVVANHKPAEPDQGAVPARPAYVMRFADGMIYLSDSHRADHIRRQRIDRGRYWVIPNGIDLSTIVPRTDPRSDDGLVRIVSIGRLVEWKQNDVLIDAVAALADDPRWALDIWGDGPDRDRLAATIPPALSDRVVLRGWCHDVNAALGTADIFAMASRSEAHPMAVLEAMAARVPVICAPAGSLADVVESGAGVLVDPPAHAAWVSQLAALIEDPARRAALADAGRARVLDRYTVETNTDAYLGVWLEMCAAGPVTSITAQ
jgi:glycosyltransferase involved in cell wall biosynthesis